MYTAYVWVNTEQSTWVTDTPQCADKAAPLLTYIVYFKMSKPSNILIKPYNHSILSSSHSIIWQIFGFNLHLYMFRSRMFIFDMPNHIQAWWLNDRGILPTDPNAVIFMFAWVLWRIAFHNLSNSLVTHTLRLRLSPVLLLTPGPPMPGLGSLGTYSDPSAVVDMAAVAAASLSACCWAACICLRCSLSLVLARLLNSGLWLWWSNACRGPSGGDGNDKLDVVILKCL